MPYIGRDAQTAQSQNKIIDDISSSFNGSTTSFALLVGGVAPTPYPVTSQNLLISVGGVIQEPDGTGTNGYQLTGANIVFSAAPASGQSFFGVVLAGADYVNAGANFPDGDAGTPSITFSQDLDTGLFRSGTGTTSFTSNNNRIADFGTTEIVFNEDGDDINFRVEGDTEANLLFVDAGNDRVGIGTTNPSQLLSIDGSAISTTFAGSVIAASSTERLRIGYRDGGPDTGLTCGQIVEDTNTLHIAGRDTVNGDIIFHAGSSVPEVMRIDATNGNVGIGTIDPKAALHVKTTGVGIPAAGVAGSMQVGDGSSFGMMLGSNGSGVGYIQPQRNDGTTTTYSLLLNPNGGNVGIWTSSPQEKLHVNAGDIVIGQSSGASTGIRNYVKFGREANPKAAIGFLNTDSNGRGDLLFMNSAASDGQEFTDAEEVMRIDLNGNVGIGTSAPATELEVNGDIGIGRSAGGYTFREVVGGNERAGIHSNSSNDLIFKVGGASEGLRILSSNGNVGIGTTSPGQELEVRADGPIIRLRDTDTALSSGELAGGIEFYQSDNSGAGVGASINAVGDGSTGRLALEFSTDDNDLAFKLFANGTARVLALAGSGNRALYVASTGSLTTSSSDASLKANVNTLGSQLEVVKQLNPISFNWIDTEERGNQLEIGFIAQEVQPLVPEVIGANNDGTLTIDYPKLTAVLTKGMQEALAKIETLETKVAALEEAS